MFNSQEKEKNSAMASTNGGYHTSGGQAQNYSASKYRGDESTGLISIHDGSNYKTRPTYRTGRDDDDGLPDPQSIKKLEVEFENVRSQLYSSKMKIRDRSREVSDQKHLNSDLKAKLRERSPTPNVSSFKSASAEVEVENNHLQRTIKTLADQLQQSQNEYPKKDVAYSLYDEITMQEKLNDKANIGFMLKSQNNEFEHLKKLLIIFQEENIRMNKLLAGGLAPSPADVDFIRDNIAKVRKEIDAILNGRHELSVKMHVVQTRIEHLNKENDDLKAQLLAFMKGNTNVLIIDPRDQKIKELEDMVQILKRDLQWAQITRPDAGMVYRVQHENSTLLSEVAKLKDKNMLLDSKIRDSLHTSELRMSNRGEVPPNPYATTLNYELHLDASSPAKRSNLATELAFHSASAKSKLLDSEYKEQFTFSHDKVDRLGGNVSAEELQKLQMRVEEFGHCNQELENLIYRLKAKIQGGSEDYYVGSSTSIVNKEFKHLESREFKDLVVALKAKVDSLCAEKAGGSKEAAEMLSYLQKILRDSVGAQHLTEQQSEVIQTNHKIAEELVALRHLHANLEQQYSSLVKINARNEGYIDDLMEQLQEFKKGLRAVTEDRDTLRQRLHQPASTK